MIDDDTIKEMAAQAGFGLIEYVGINDRERAFTRAVWSHGRDAGLDEAAAVCERKAARMEVEADEAADAGDGFNATSSYASAWVLRVCGADIEALKENKHDQ